MKFSFIFIFKLITETNKCDTRIKMHYHYIFNYIYNLKIIFFEPMNYADMCQSASAAATKDKGYAFPAFHLHKPTASIMDMSRVGPVTTVLTISQARSNNSQPAFTKGLFIQVASKSPARMSRLPRNSSSIVCFVP